MTYGTGTRSYNRSPEKRRTDEERAAATAKHLAQPKGDVEVPTGCPCCRRVVCVWGPGPVWPTSPDWIKLRALGSEKLDTAEAAVRDRERQDSGVRKPKVDFLAL